MTIFAGENEFQTSSKSGALALVFLGGATEVAFTLWAVKTAFTCGRLKPPLLGGFGLGFGGRW